MAEALACGVPHSVSGDAPPNARRRRHDRRGEIVIDRPSPGTTLLTLVGARSAQEKPAVFGEELLEVRSERAPPGRLVFQSHNLWTP
jgi:hypothetical protein